MRRAPPSNLDMLLKSRLVTMLIGILCLAGLVVAHARTSERQQQSTGTVALVNGRVYRSPDAPPIERGTVVITDGRIAAVGASADIRPPAGATVIDCAGQTITAGFWNSHVHLMMNRVWQTSKDGPAEPLSAALEKMLTRHGFTSVMDTGSYWEDTSALRKRVESGEVRGPRILTAGEIIFPKGGMPPAQPSIALARPMLEAGTPEETAAIAQRKLDQGMDAVKLYVATWWGEPRARMPQPVVEAVVKTAHARGKLVLAHPSDRIGIDTALAAGVDILLHTAPDSGVWDDDLLARMRAKNIALVPTLKLWKVELEKDNAPPAVVKGFQGRGIAQLAAYSKAGGDILFGTDVGYVADDDVQEEFAKMAEAGMTARQILASLSTTPARRFGIKSSGELKAGADGDVVVLEGNPETDVQAFTRVRRVIRGGRTLWTSADASPVSH